jgi:DNA mismatch repair protein MSH6
LVEGGDNGVSPTLLSLLRAIQSTSQLSFSIETIRQVESFPQSTALDKHVRQQLERNSGSRFRELQPWNVEETLEELHRRKYYPSGSKTDPSCKSVTRWPPVLRAAVEGNAELALSSFGAALFYLQRNLIDAEMLSMGLVKAYVPPESCVATERSPQPTAQLEALQAADTAGGENVNARASSSQSDDMNVDHIERKTAKAPTHMALDGTTLHNLEVLSNSVDHKVTGSLWSKINYTKTPHGARLLRAWLLRPLFQKADIERRLDAVHELVSGSAAAALADTRSVLSKCGDFERLLSRVHSMSGTASAEEDGENDRIHPNERAILYEMPTYTKRKVGDFSKLLNGLQAATQIPELFNNITIKSGLLRKVVHSEDNGGCFPSMATELEWFFNNFDCDQAAKGLFEPSRGMDDQYDEACDAINDIMNELNEFKNEMCASELSPPSLAKSSWKYVNTKPDSKDKYLIELPASVTVPDHFIMKGKRGSGHKQVNKYRTPEVERLVQNLEKAYEVQRERKARGMELVFMKFDSKRTLWAAAAQATALLDALGSLAHTASKPGYCRPIIEDAPPEGLASINITQGRHPCVESNAAGADFIPNDLSLGNASDGEYTIEPITRWIEYSQFNRRARAHFFVKHA